MKHLSSLLILFCFGLVSAQTQVIFWHSQDATEELVQTFADEFNASQSDYVILPEYAGNYQEASIKLAAALGGSNAPAMFDAEVTVFPRLLEEDAIANLSDLISDLPAELMDDFYPALWDYGLADGERYGLPWNMSMPVLFYNETALEQRNVAPPTTWGEFEAAAERLTTRNTKGYIDVAAAFIFEALVTTRGSSVVTEEGQPNFDSPEAVEALTMLQRMSRERSSIPRGFGDLDQALVDFARTKAMMAIASEAFFPQGERFTVAFEVAAAPLPVGSSSAVPLMAAQLVVLKNASQEQQQAAVAFWEFLMQPEVQQRWVEESYFLPVRRSVAETLQPWYEASPSRGAALAQLENAVERPRVGAYTTWQGYLQEAIERATKGRGDPAEVLQEAQRRALESR